MANKSTTRAAEDAALTAQQEAQAPVQTEAKAAPARAGGKDDAWFYIGPDIKGLVGHNDFFRGTLAQVLAKAGQALEAHPEVQEMIVPAQGLARAREQVKTPGTALNLIYKKLKEAKENER